jgi:thiol-disulfide isomerase/thioredoxin
MGVRRASTFLAVACVVLLALFIVDEKAADRLGEVRRFFRSIAGQDSYEAEQEPRPGIKLYRRTAPANSEYPEILAAKSLVVILGADWCQWCKEEAKELSGPSHEYNIFYANVDEERWAKFMDDNALGLSVPVTLLIEDGRIVKTWNGYTPWAEIQPLAEKARKNEDEQKEGFIIGPIDGGDGDRIDMDRQQRNRRRR